MHYSLARWHQSTKTSHSVPGGLETRKVLRNSGKSLPDSLIGEARKPPTALRRMRSSTPSERRNCGLSSTMSQVFAWRSDLHRSCEESVTGVDFSRELTFLKTLEPYACRAQLPSSDRGDNRISLYPNLALRAITGHLNLLDHNGPHARSSLPRSPRPHQPGDFGREFVEPLARSAGRC